MDFKINRNFFTVKSTGYDQKEKLDLKNDKDCSHNESGTSFQSGNSGILGRISVNFKGNNTAPVEIGPCDLDLSTFLAQETRECTINPVNEYEKLQDGDKKALKHLVKAAKFLDPVFTRQEHHRGLEIQRELALKADEGDLKAQKALKIYNILNGIQDERKNTLFLIKDEKLLPGKNVYPIDLTAEELTKYLKENIDQAAEILSNNTIVRRKGNKLVAMPYQEYFKSDFHKAAEEIKKAAECTTHEGLRECLKLQAEALFSTDPEVAFKADVKWASLDDAPLDFSICRESYSDELSSAVFEDAELRQMLKDRNIDTSPKDFFGTRVGIVNQDSAKLMHSFKAQLDNMNNEFPLNDQYEYSSKTDTLLDLDLVYIGGEEKAARPGVTAAQNLPNDDKLSVKRGFGKKNVFHRQIRYSVNQDFLKKCLDALVDESQRDMYDIEAEHLFVIGHELSHSLGPKTTRAGLDKKIALGDYGDILEEAKADLGSITTSNYLVNAGLYSKEDQQKIFLTYAFDLLPLREPPMADPHRVMRIMQFNYLKEHGAINFEPKGKLSINPEIFVSVAKKMLEEVIQIQLDGDVQLAKVFTEKYFQWSPPLKYASETKLEFNPREFRNIKQVLADKLVSEV